MENPINKIRERWEVIRIEWRRRTNTAERVGVAGLALCDVMEAESQARQNADTALAERIEAETTARMQADAAINQRIGAETTARIQGDANTLAAANAHTNQSIAAIQVPGHYIGMVIESGLPATGQVAGDWYFITNFDVTNLHVRKCVRRVHRLMGWSEHKSNDRLIVCELCEYSTSERLDIVERLIYHFKPDFVFLDGVKELIASINNETTATDICYYLRKWSIQTNSHICSVLHENKGDTHLRGHVGTELQNKSETVVSVVKLDKYTSKVIPRLTRNEEFNEFYFEIDSNGLPRKCEPKKGSKPADKLKLLLETILTANSAGLRYTDLCKQIETVGNIKEKTAQGKIKKATDEGIIRKCELSGRYLLSSPIDEDDENEGNDAIDTE